MIDINRIRADFARYLAEHAATRHSLDAALMHVVERAYQQGIEDAMQVPPVLRDALTNLDAGTPAGLRGPLAVGATAVPAAGVPGQAAGAGQGGGAEGGDGAAAQGRQEVTHTTTGVTP